jgi:hypothetical protein
MKKINFKFVIIVSVGIIAVVTLFTNLNFKSKVSASKDPYQENALRNIKTSNEKISSEIEVPFVKINGVSFSNKDFHRTKMVRKSNLEFNRQQPDDDTKILKKFIKEKAVLLEADKQGIVVTRKEAEDYAKGARKAVSQSEEQKQSIDNIINALGLTEDEYWNEYSVDAYLVLSKVGKLKRIVLDEELARNKDATSQELSAYWNAYQEKLANEAVVEMQ